MGLGADPITPQSAILHRHTHFIPKKAVGGKGIYIFLEDGTKFLDSTGGAAVSCLGHGHEKVSQAVIQQIEQLSYCHSAFFGTDVAEELARFLTDSTGSEAVEAALKLARQYYLELPTPQPQRTRFIARSPSYHGITLGALGAGGHVLRREPFEPLLAHNTSHVSPCYAYRGKSDGESDAEYVERLAAELDAEFQRVGPETVCAFIAETVVGAANDEQALGAVPPVPGYLRAMKRICTKHGALFILDEVMSGMGRTGTLHAWEPESVIPDLQTIGKGLGGGYVPVSGVLIGDEIVRTLDRGSGAFRHGQTYQGHPVSCAAALATQRVIKEEGLLENVRIEFVQNRTTKEPFPTSANVAFRIQETGLDPAFAISLYAASGTVDGTRGDHVLLAPPYNVTREEIDLIVERTARVIESVFERVEREMEMTTSGTD
ncbi:hypothetical protein N8T08_002470 [Aspergillus melleus]|uniref:Uncharacterized protein n=1 Tax=Aspergillus melleus TaxID=138277 RepID=A0ACC3ALX8_9EURO|nr:hypothetical protein N8T08_002470 [Aspergillus melleus]